MARAVYVLEDFGTEVVAPSGYYLPVGREFIEYNGKRLLHVVGNFCIEASCCGVGSWNYVRVEGYVVDDLDSQEPDTGNALEIETIEDDSEKVAINKLLLQKHPGARIEFR